MEEQSNLERLRVLTEKLPNPSLASFVQALKPGYIEYAVEGGMCFGLALHSSPEVAVQRAFLSAGTVFPLHSHRTFEIVVVVTGLLREEKDGEEPREVGTGGVIHVPPGHSHRETALEDTWVVAITIPMSESYPNVPK